MADGFSISGGERLKAKLETLSRDLTAPGTMRAGVLEGSTYPDGTPTATVAAVQEFGAPSRGIPPRPFMRNMIAKEEGHWGSDVAAILKANGGNAPAALALMGEEIAGEIRQSIRDLTDPPLAESTIKAKGFDKPLVDTGHLLASISSEVVE